MSYETVLYNSLYRDAMPYQALAIQPLVHLPSDFTPKFFHNPVTDDPNARSFRIWSKEKSNTPVFPFPRIIARPSSAPQNQGLSKPKRARTKKYNFHNSEAPKINLNLAIDSELTHTNFLPARLKFLINSKDPLENALYKNIVKCRSPDVSESDPLFQDTVRDVFRITPFTRTEFAIIFDLSNRLANEYVIANYFEQKTSSFRGHAIYFGLPDANYEAGLLRSLGLD